MDKKERSASLERSERRSAERAFAAKLRYALAELERSLAWDEN